MRKLFAAARKLIAAHFWLIVVMGIGAVLVVIFGFGMHHKRWYFFALRTELDHSQGWEVGALLWTIPCAFYYWFGFKEKSELRLKAWSKRVQWAGVSLCIAAFLVAGAITMTGTNLGLKLSEWSQLSAPGADILHASLVFGIAFCFLCADWLLGMTKAAVLADFPMVIALAVLCAFVVLHQDCGHGQTGLLVAGAIAFQLIVSNVLFVLVEAKVIEPSVLERLAWCEAPSPLSNPMSSEPQRGEGTTDDGTRAPVASPAA